MKAEISVNVNTSDLTRQSYQYHEVDLKEPLSPYIPDRSKDELNGSQSSPSNNHIVIQNELSKEVNPNNYVTLIHLPPAYPTEESHTCQHTVNRFTERIYVTPSSTAPRKSCSSACQYNGGPSHYKETLHLTPSQTPVNFKESFIVIRDTTRRRYRMTLECEPKVKPQKGSATLWIRPKRSEVNYVSRVDHKASVYYRSAVHLVPRSFCNNLIEDFDFLDDSDGESLTEVSDDDDYGCY